MVHARALIRYAFGFMPAGFLAGAPSIGSARGERIDGVKQGAADVATASITGNLHGTIPPAACVERDRDGIVLRAFEETTEDSGSGGRGSAGTFELVMETACVAPFFQALFAHEHLSTRITFAGRALRTSFSITLEDAQLTHLDLRLASADGRSLPLVTVGLAAAHVFMGNTKGPMAQAVPQERLRARTFRAAAGLDAAATSVEAWTRRGVTAAIHLSAAEPAIDERSRISQFRLSVASTRPRGGARIRVVLYSIVRSDLSTGRPEHEWPESQVRLSQAALRVNGKDGITGITIWLEGAQIARVESRANGAVSPSFRLSARGLTITDISSGHTASRP